MSDLICPLSLHKNEVSRICTPRIASRRSHNSLTNKINVAHILVLQFTSSVPQDGIKEDGGGV